MGQGQESFLLKTLRNIKNFLAQISLDPFSILLASFHVIKDRSEYWNLSGFAHYLTEQGLRYDRQKLNLYYVRGKVPKADFSLGNGTKYWHQSTVKGYCEQEKNRLK